MANPTPTSSETFQRKIASFCEIRLSPLLQPRSIENLTSYLLGLIGHYAYPPMKSGKLDWQEIALACDLTNELTADVKRTAQHGFDAISRWLAANKATVATGARLAEKRNPAQRLTRNRQAAAKPSAPATKHSAKSGPKPVPIEEFPNPLFDRWEEPVSFQAALELHMRRFGESYYYLHGAVIRPDETFDNKTILSWLKGTKVPRTIDSLEVLGRIERRYRLPSGYFKAKLPHQSRSASGHDLGDDISPAERRRLAWHLPDNFNSLPFTKREEILEWVRRVIISGSTDYRRFQAAASKQRYAIRFPALAYGRRGDIRSLTQTLAQSFSTVDEIEDPDILSGVIDAPPRLAMEMADLIMFKTVSPGAA